MTTIDTHSHAPAAARASAGHGTGLAAVAEWITAADHKKIGRLFAGTALVALLGVAAVAALAAFERIDTGATAFEGAFTQLYSLARVGTPLFVVVPLVLGIAVAVVPLQLGARSLALPRLAAAGYWTWLVGTVLAVIAIARNGGPGGGDADMVQLFLAALVLVLLGLLATAVSIATSILTTRAPGMHLRRVPPFAWSALVASIGLVLMLPVLVGTLIELLVDVRSGGETFGGTDELFGWFSFGVTQPQTFVYAVMAFGVVAEIAPLVARARLALRGVLFTGIGLVGTAALAGVTQVRHDLPWPGSDLNLDDFGDKLADLLPYALFNVLPLLGPLAVLGAMALTLRGGRPRVLVTFAPALLGATMVVLGMLGQVLVPILDLGLSGTVFEEGSFTFVCYGTVLAGIAAAAHWGPKLWGRELPVPAVGGLALLGAAAAVLASAPYYVAGFADQPAAAAVFDYDGSPELWNTLVAVGHALMALVVLAFVGLAAKGFATGRPAGDDPWGGQTLEWAVSSPPPEGNFPEVPTVASPEPLADLRTDDSRGDA